MVIISNVLKMSKCTKLMDLEQNSFQSRNDRRSSPCEGELRCDLQCPPAAQ